MIAYLNFEIYIRFNICALKYEKKDLLMKVNFSRVFPLLMLSFALYAGNESPKLRLSGHVPVKAITSAVFLEKMAPQVKVPLTFILPLRNQDELEELVKRMHDPEDQEYFGQYLTTEEFNEQFAPTQEDYDKVIAYAKSIGFSVSQTHPNRTLLNVKGSVGAVESSFNLRLNVYKTPQGRKFYSANHNPEVPVSIASVINGIEGLDNLAVWRPFHHRKEVSENFHAHGTNANAIPSGPGGGYSPSDLLKAYNLSSVAANGSGQSIALFELAAYQASDINTYTRQFGLPAAKLTNILVDGGSGTGIDAEVTLDIELALALAPESLIYVYEGPNSNQGVLDTYNRIATDNLAKQVSTSWGLAEDLVSTQYLQAENAIFLQMAAHGQTIYAAAGDSGAYDDDNKSTPVVDDPASQPYVVGVGGTRLSVDPISGAYLSESCWNEGRGNGAGGGGVSTFWPIPTWQVNVPSTYSKTKRNVPDVSLNADPSTGYSIFYDGGWQIYGGTSCAAPLWAAFNARVNQELTSNQKPVLGFANPVFYSLGEGKVYNQDFHDIISGDNLYYHTSNSYDNATGWGSFNGANLFASLTNSTPTPPPPMLSPLLNIAMTHNAPFIKNRTNTYHITVSNTGGGPTSGNVNVAITLPRGFSYRAYSGSGWSFNPNTLTFTQTNTLAPNASYAPITLYVNVNRRASSSVTTTATVSGGGSVSSTISNQTTVK